MNIKEFLDQGGAIFIEGRYAQLSYLGKSMAIPHHYLFATDAYDKDILVAYLKTMTNLNKSKEQLDAEEAVEKAKASLEAAQKVLESVKGKNN